MAGRGTRHARTFQQRKHAESFAAQKKRDKNLRILAPMQRGKITLDEFFEEWKCGHGIHLARSTRDDYDAIWARYISSALGGYTLEEISERPEIVQSFRAGLAQRTGPPTVRRTLMILQGVWR